MVEVVCRTEGCANCGYVIVMQADADAYACGPCGQPISDIVVLAPVTDAATLVSSED